MKHTFRLFFEPDRKHPKRAIKELVARFAGLELDATGDMVVSEDGAKLRKLRDAARKGGFAVSMVVGTELKREDALLGAMGLLSPAGSDAFLAKLPPDAFDFSKACQLCGLGAVQVKPYILGAKGVKCQGAFYAPDDSFRVIMRAEIGNEMAKAIGRPGCFRNVVTREGNPVKEWVETVPMSEMPAMSVKSEGVVFGKACAACGRAPWGPADDTPSRIVYRKAAVAAAQKHGVVEMHEPYRAAPEFDAARGKFKGVGGRPLLVFSRAAVEVLMKYIEPEKGFPANTSITPVFSE